MMAQDSDRSMSFEDDVEINTGKKESEALSLRETEDVATATGKSNAIVTTESEDCGHEPAATEQEAVRTRIANAPWERVEEANDDPIEALGFVEVEEHSDSDEATREVVVFSNERYNALSNSWSSAALLPTDRRALSSDSGHKSWRDMASCESEVLGVHWSWVDCAWRESSSWEYAQDFGRRSFEKRRDRTGRFDFVRRRRLKRTARLRLVESGEQRCTRVDPGAEAAVATRLAQALSIASLSAARDEEDDETLTIKTIEAMDYLIDTLGLGSGGFDKKETSLATDLSKFQSGFARKHVSRIQNLLRGDNSVDAASEADRRSRFDKIGVLGAVRCLARAAVRAYDPSGRGACDSQHSPKCLFVIVKCPSCSGIFSTRAALDHDALCDYKRVPCEACTGPVERRFMAIHRTRDCPKRSVRCAFGCTHSLAADELGAHYENANPAHCLLLLQRTTETADALKQHDDRLVDLEKQVATALDFARATQTKLDAVAASLSALKLDLQAEIKAESENACRALAKQLKLDVAKLTSPIPALQRTVATLERNINFIDSTLRHPSPPNGNS